ncbi:MAG: hypothetical protein RLZZ08_624 [Pseudomonadota bacterium]
MRHRAITPILLAAILCAGSAAVAQSARPAALAIAVTGLHSAKGNLVACLWRDKAGFPSCNKSRTARRLVLPVTGTAMQVQFPDVAPGRYAVTVEHDENADGKSGRNLIGMPTEGVGVSNNPGGMPGWDKSLFDFTGNGGIPVRIRYLFG